MKVADVAPNMKRAQVEGSALRSAHRRLICYSDTEVILESRLTVRIFHSCLKNSNSCECSCCHIHLALYPHRAAGHSQYRPPLAWVDLVMDYLRTLGSAAVSSLVQKSGLTLPFSLGARVTSFDNHSIWNLYDGTKRVGRTNTSMCPSSSLSGA